MSKVISQIFGGNLLDGLSILKHYTCLSFSALRPIRPPDLTQQMINHQLNGLTQNIQDNGLGSARPVDLNLGVDLNTGIQNSHSEFLRPIQQPIVHRGPSLEHKIKPGPTIRPTAPPVR